MSTLRTAVLAGTATVLFAGAALAASGKFHTVAVDLPDGSVAQIEYVGDVAPKVNVVPLRAQVAAQMDPFAEIERISAQVEQQQRAMMQQFAEMQRQAAAHPGQAGQVIVTGSQPAGLTYQYTAVSTSSGKGGACTQTVEWRSDGSGKQPQITRASSGDCEAVRPSDKAVPASAPKQKAPRDPNMI